MSKKYLFVAEADKIQDLLFRSSKLREVTGGSQMLEEFCREAAPQIIQRLKLESKEIISAGGTFRILFDSKENAEEFGEYLAEFYRSELGGTITIAEPLEVTSEQDAEKLAISQAQRNLRRAKHRDKLSVSVEQMPYIAICASCGIGIANEYKSRFEDEPENYLCQVCEKKAKVREHIKEKFLSKFLSYIQNEISYKIDFPRKDADEVAELESRNYIAYIIADGNNMGTLFNSCDDFDQLNQLSKGLDTVIQRSLAEPTKILLEKQNKVLRRPDKDFTLIPVLPLILGGDDVFALIPAQWALDFSLQFSKEFEKNMNNLVKDIELQNKHSPTISAAIIICKGKFPYLAAHEIAEELMKIAKKRAKEEESSAVSFTVVTGSDIVKAPEEEKKFVAGFPAYTINELEKLIEYRAVLKDLPGTRRAQLENLFLRAEEFDFQEMKKEWISERDSILGRLEEKLRNNVNKALVELGDSGTDDNWLRIGKIYFHQLPDLLRAWDFAYDLEKDISEYEEEKEK